VCSCTLPLRTLLCQTPSRRGATKDAAISFKLDANSSSMVAYAHISCDFLGTLRYCGVALHSPAVVSRHRFSQSSLEVAGNRNRVCRNWCDHDAGGYVVPVSSSPLGWCRVRCAFGGCCWVVCLGLPAKAPQANISLTPKLALVAKHTKANGC